LFLNDKQITYFSNDQWESEGQKYGKTGQQLKSDVMLAKGIADASVKPLQEAAEAARREAQEAKEELKRLRERKNVDSAEEDFYNKNTALRFHKKEINEFLSSYPDKDSVDEKTLKSRLELASKFVKGSVKENMRTNKPSESGSTRLEGSDEQTNPEDIGDFDPKGTGNAGGAQLMSNIHANFGKGVRRSDSIDVWKKSLDDEGRGVSISMDEDLEKYNAMRDRDTVGGKRG